MKGYLAAQLLCLACLGGCVAAVSKRAVQPNGQAEQTVEIDHDGVVIDERFMAAHPSRTVRVRFAPGAIADTGGDGVLHVWASNVTIECEGTLKGAESGVKPDKFTGTGVRIEGASDVTVKGLSVTGYKVGVRAVRTDGLTIDGASFDNLWRMHLKSTPQKEHNDDWLWPHENDQSQWVTNYGAAACIEKSSGVTVRNVTVRNGQNGLILDRVSGSRIYDNDCSFLSGWGVAMWRSCDNLISRNALDFCVRGYSHGVYNRGQDSAGLLMFEQCSRNTVIENSITHGGDGVFGFAGKEALGEKPSGIEHRRAGCNDNVFVGNDLSFAPAHGLEMTFSFGNVIEGNTFEGNAICGIWGGYSQGTLIRKNTFTGNGQKGYGEGGGINIEHGTLNAITDNDFSGNSVAVKLWDDDDGNLLKTPWAVANHKGSRENDVMNNRVKQEGGAPFWVRKTQETRVLQNRVSGALQEVDTDAVSTFAPQPPAPCCVEASPKVTAAGSSRPAGARDRWRGREWIVIGEWGPVAPVTGGAH